MDNKKPWVLEGNDPDKRYPFSSSAVIFIYFRVKIYHINDELLQINASFAQWAS